MSVADPGRTTTDGSQPAGVPARPETPLRPISRTRVERAATVGLAGFGLLIGAQTVPILIEQQPALRQPWTVVIGFLFAVCLVAMVILAARGRSVRFPAAAFPVIYLVALAGWPLMVLDPQVGVSSKPWLWYLCNVATAGAAIAFSTTAATAFTIVIPVLYGVVRLTPAGGGASLQSAAFDVLYALVLGGVLLVLVTMIRAAASDVDAAQSAALERYAEAVGQHAREVERVEVDALVHDSVLTTLLGAASARSVEQQDFAGTMAARALRLLEDVGEAVPVDGEPDAEPVGIVALGRRLREAAEGLTRPFAVSVAGDPGVGVPEPVAESIVAAAVQAMTNSVQHAGEGRVARRIEVRGTTTDATIVSVVDDGRGFEMDQAFERIGMRVSIRERLARAGGHAVLESAPGEGTRVHLIWPASAADTTERPYSAPGAPGADS